MSSDLRHTRDHCRRMQAADHTSDCQAPRTFQGLAVHDLYGRLVIDHPDPACDGCISDTDRERWAQLADDIDRWLNNDTHQQQTDQPDLFEGET